jgi:hypothetical protein
MAKDGMTVQIRDLAGAQKVNKRGREEKAEIESVSLVFGCLRSRTCISLPLTVTDADTTCRATG